LCEILEQQIQVEAEQWTQVQDVLKHVCTEMTTLQQACQGWEKRALNAESQSVACQLEVIVGNYCHSLIAAFNFQSITLSSSMETEDGELQEVEYNIYKPCTDQFIATMLHTFDP
jgi:hypothetical protein